MNNLDKLCYLFLGLGLLIIIAVYCFWFFNYNDDDKIKKFMHSQEYQTMIKTNANSITSEVKY